MPPFCYEYECVQCAKYFEQTRKLGDRAKPATCPTCGSDRCGRVFLSAPRVQWFPGSYSFDSRAEKLDKLAKEAQAEGFRSKEEVEAAVGQAHDRAKRLGIPVEKILGGQKAHYEGEVKVDPNDAAKHKQLYRNYLDAGMLKKDIKKAAAAKQELATFEVAQRKKHQDARKRVIKDRPADIATAKAQAKNFQKQV